MQPFDIAGARDAFTFDQPAAAFGPRSERVVFVDVGTRKAVESTIARNGIPIKHLPIDPTVFDDFFAGRPSVTQKVVSQSIPPGTSVRQGTTVNLELAEPSNVPIGVVQGVVTAIAAQPMAAVYEGFVAGKPEITRILARSADTDVLTPSDEAVITDTFAENGIDLVEEPGSDVAAALVTLQAAWTFGQ